MYSTCSSIIYWRVPWNVFRTFHLRSAQKRSRHWGIDFTKISFHDTVALTCASCEAVQLPVCNAGRPHGPDRSRTLNTTQTQNLAYLHKRIALSVDHHVWTQPRFVCWFFKYILSMPDFSTFLQPHILGFRACLLSHMSLLSQDIQISSLSLDVFVNINIVLYHIL
jgi:hypothetical protein